MAEEKRNEAVEKLKKDQPGKKETKTQKLQDSEGFPVHETGIIEPAGVDLSLYRRIGEKVTKVIKHKPGMLHVKKIIRSNMDSRTTCNFLPRDRKG